MHCTPVHVSKTFLSVSFAKLGKRRAKGILVDIVAGILFHAKGPSLRNNSGTRGNVLSDSPCVVR